jgi:hypothetical protein
MLLAIWLVLAPWTTGTAAAGPWNDMAAGLLVLLLTLPRGAARERYAGWDRFVV